VEMNGVGRCQADVESAVYFCCLEALQNAAKYAGAGTQAHVHVWKDDGMLLFEVSDSGAGFDPREASQGIGLTNMRDRLGAVGGTLEIESSPGKGTRVRGTVPATGT